jgi:hypothetical protein
MIQLSIEQLRDCIDKSIDHQRSTTRLRTRRSTQIYKDEMRAIEAINEIVIIYYIQSQCASNSFFQQKHALSCLRRICIALDEIILHSENRKYTNKNLSLLHESVHQKNRMVEQSILSRHISTDRYQLKVS